MTDGVKSSENDRWTFGGSDQTPGLDVEGVTDVVEAVAVDEILTCMAELVQGVCEKAEGRTRESLEPVEYSRSSMSSSSSVDESDSSSSLAVVAAECMVAILAGPVSPDGLFGATS